MKWTYLFIAICAEVFATSALKASEGFSKLWPSLGVVAGYGVAFYFLSLTLDSIPVGLAYAIWSGVGIVLISLVGWRLFGQTLDAAALAGIGLIVAGRGDQSLFEILGALSASGRRQRFIDATTALP